MPVTITSVRSTSAERVSIALDNGQEIKMTLSAAAELRLYAGKQLEERELETLRSSAALSLCKNRALELLSYRPMSQKELRDKLVQKGEESQIAEASVQWLAEQGFLNDETYAGMVARHYAAKGYGQGRVRQELRRRGIDRSLWENAVEEMPDPDDKLERFLAARLKDPGDRDQVRKVSAALLRRGYSWEEIHTALARHCAEIEEEE